MTNMLDPSQIVSNDLVRGSKEEGKDEAGNHKNKESDICSIVNLLLSAVPVLADRNSGPNDRPEIENSPKDTDISTLLVLHRV